MKKKLFKIKDQSDNTTKELRVFEDKNTRKALILLNARKLNINEIFKQQFTENKNQTT